MDDRQAQEMLERIEVPIPVQQRVPLAQAERGDQAIDRLPHGMTAAAKGPKIPSCRECEGRSPGLQHLKLEEFPLHPLQRGVVADALQDLAQDEDRQAETLAANLHVQPIGLHIFEAAEVIDPHGCVDNDHVALFRDAPQSRGGEIPFPGDLAPQAADSCLRAGLDQQAQPRFHGRSFRSRAARAHGPFDQPIIDVDVGSHTSNPYV